MEESKRGWMKASKGQYRKHIMCPRRIIALTQGHCSVRGTVVARSQPGLRDAWALTKKIITHTRPCGVREHKLQWAVQRENEGKLSRTTHSRVTETLNDWVRPGVIVREYQSIVRQPAPRTFWGRPDRRRRWGESVKRARFISLLKHGRPRWGHICKQQVYWKEDQLQQGWPSGGILRPRELGQRNNSKGSSLH